MSGTKSTAGCGTARNPSPEAKRFLGHMGSGWHFENYPADGPTRELRLHHKDLAGGSAYLVQRKGSTLVTVRYPQHGFNYKDQQVSAALAARTKAADKKFRAAAAKNRKAGKVRLPVTPRGK